ncbi:MAG: Lrp/AsnC family transcriptional regulator [Candidatus Gastranaerophilales bacterium]|nr:Lrp/AsnC family transcriptional regulator [Candidatus Gastranaerophilales bacterium]
MQKINVDEISLKILALLQKDARMSFTEIGKEIGLTSSSVAERVKRLENYGIIENYTINLNPEKMGFPITAIMLVSFAGIFTQQEKDIVNALSKYYQVIECLRITGKNDFLIKIMVSSMDEFKIINDEVAKFGQVETSLVVTTFTKNTTVDIEKMLKTEKI